MFGMYRRHMKTISYLGSLDKVFGAPATTRNWNTITAIVKVLAAASSNHLSAAATLRRAAASRRR